MVDSRAEEMGLVQADSEVWVMVLGAPC